MDITLDDLIEFYAFISDVVPIGLSRSAGADSLWRRSETCKLGHTTNGRDVDDHQSLGYFDPAVAHRRHTQSAPDGSYVHELASRAAVTHLFCDIGDAVNRDIDHDHGIIDYGVIDSNWWFE